MDGIELCRIVKDKLSQKRIKLSVGGITYVCNKVIINKDTILNNSSKKGTRLGLFNNVKNNNRLKVSFWRDNIKDKNIDSDAIKTSIFEKDITSRIISTKDELAKSPLDGFHDVYLTNNIQYSKIDNDSIFLSSSTIYEQQTRVSSSKIKNSISQYTKTSLELISIDNKNQLVDKETKENLSSVNTIDASEIFRTKKSQEKITTTKVVRQNIITTLSISLPSSYNKYKQISKKISRATSKTN